MSLIDVRKRSQFKINSTLLISGDLFPSCEIEGEYLETFAITPIIIIENIKIKNKADIFEINAKKRIYDQLFVLARIYLYADNKDNFISFYFGGFPFSYSLEDINPETIKKIKKI